MIKLEEIAYTIFVFIFSGFLLSVYFGWAIYFIHQLVYLRRKRINLKYKETEENIHLRYHYKTEYYKFALMLTVISIEAFLFGMTAISNEIAKHLIVTNTNTTTSTSTSLIKTTILLTINALTVVSILATVSLLNILTTYVSYVCHSYTEFSPIKRKLRNLIILIVTLVLLTLLIVIGAVVTQLLAVILGTYEYIQFIKNSKQLYNLLKMRNRQLLLDNQYQEYQKQKKIVKRYALFTKLILVALAGFMTAFWVDILYTTIPSILAFQPIEAMIRISNNRAYIALYTTLKWTERTIIGISSGVFSITIIWITLVAIFENKNCANSAGLCGKRNKRADLMGPLLP